MCERVRHTDFFNVLQKPNMIGRGEKKLCAKGSKYVPGLHWQKIFSFIFAHENYKIFYCRHDKNI
jgi:hypothetical protein